MTDVTHAAGALQLSAEQEAGVEAIVDVMYIIFSKGNTEAVELINTENAFNLKFSCLLISTDRSNCFAIPARLLFFNRSEKLYKEGTTQNDPTSVGAYAFAILPMLHSLLAFILTNKLKQKLLLVMILQWLKS